MPSPRTLTPGGIVTRCFDEFLSWVERARQRRHLARLSDRMLGDIGLSRADVEREFARPFWRAASCGDRSAR